MIFDLHNDLLTAGISDDELFRFMKQTVSGKNSAVLALWTSKLTEPFGCIKKKIYFASLLKKYFLEQEDVKKETNSGNLFFAVEDLFFAGYHNIDDILSLPLEYCGLTWNYENQLAGGAKSDGVLTELGKHVIDKMNQRNIPVDTSHLNKKSFWSVVNYSKRAVINSHTCFEGVNSHCRNLDDRQIQAVIDSGGIVGLTIVPQFLREKGAAASGDIVRHTDYFINKFGYKNLALGTDFYGVEHLPKDVKEYDDFEKVRTKLKKLGYSNKVIDSIFYSNAYKFFKNIKKP